MSSALFFFGAMSPYSWFAAERIAGLMPDAQWKPVFAGGLFESCGRRSWGLDERRGLKILDCERRAEHHGLGPMRWPDRWPTTDILVARGMAFAEREGRLSDFALAAMRSAFVDGAELSELAALQRVAETVGLDPGALTTAVQDPVIKDAVRAGNDHALSLGVCGVPTVVLGPELFWGDDRLVEAAEASRRCR